MPEEINRALGMQGGGFPAIVTNDDGTEKTWLLSDCSIEIQAKHVAWLKGKLRREKIAQREEGIISPEECVTELRLLDQDFAMGNYSFCGPYWRQCMVSKDAGAKLYQLLLEKHHPEVAKWTLQDVENVVMANDQSKEAFRLAAEDILPKAMTDLGMKKEAEAVKAELLSKSARS